MGTADRTKLRRILAGQEGIITLRQTASCGLHRSAVARRCASGEWRTVGPGVFHATDHRLTIHARIRAAVWSAGRRAVLCGPAAAFWRGYTRTVPATIHVTVPRGRSARKPLSPTLGDVQLWHRNLHDDDRTEVRKVAITSPALTVLDAAALLGMTFLDRALQAKKVTVEDLVAADARYPGRRGARVVAPMLDAAAAGARSPAERRALAMLLGSADLPQWQLNYPAVEPYEVDVAFVAHKVAVEIDGMAYHSDAEAFQRDRARGNALTGAGWVVLHFTWADVVERPEQTLAIIRWHLALAERHSA
ncbi:hypothetical protein C6V83_04865 [Gordonia iterans]|uniref:DUF559 domain-containing protein n=1 Tax=Gordonia iterans TaxID=1004901 RepID=A0A2S0KDE2_9ACTN|nr:type IV toxin-antitoxin system AbiEi family antitoxin domain-containing protein [Gordonia iterans]AVL99707.1 hypothetical protein C6V83_04865 [Gordonia iterans]